MLSLERNLKDLKTKINATEKQYSRIKDSVTLLAVSKQQPANKIIQLYNAGQHHFAESYCQEALKKINELNHTDIIWHFIGPIQSNKCQMIANNFSWVHSVSRIKVANSLNLHRHPDLPPLNICIQVNIEHSPNKSGILLEDLDSFCKQIADLKNLKLRGLMTIPEIHHNFEEQCEPYTKLSQALTKLNKQGYSLDTLSMGMSGDYSAAIAQGASFVRIGTLLFGPRTNQPRDH